jgi:AcrR family transcriptional regulator
MTGKKVAAKVTATHIELESSATNYGLGAGGSPGTGGKKMDRRIARTRNALGDALVALIQEKKFEDITVQEVLDRAGVGRSTFYVHYHDKEDLFVSDVEDFFAMFSTVLKRHGASPKRLAPVAEFCAHIQDVREFYMALRKSEKLNDVRALGRGFFARSIEERLRTAGVENNATRRMAKAHALAGSMFSLIDWWVDTGMKVEPMEVDEIFHTTAWKGLGER